MAKRASAPGNAKTAVAYLRVSTDDQSLGVEAQRASIAAWAAKAGVEIVAELVDRGISGGSELDERPGLVAALAQLRAMKAGLLVIGKRCRLARDVVIAALIERAVRSCGAFVVSADGIGNGSEPQEVFMRTIVDASYALERGLIRQRTKAALAVKKARGERVGEVPFGHRLSTDGQTLESDAGEQAIIARVIELHSRGLSYRALAATLAAEGVTSPRSGKPLAAQSAHRIIRRCAA